DRDLGSYHAELRKLSAGLRPGDGGLAIGRLAELQQRIGQVQERARKVRELIEAARKGLVDQAQAAEALRLFDPVWLTLSPLEQARVVGLLVEQVNYDGDKGKVSIAFRAAGIKTLARELADRAEQERIA